MIGGTPMIARRWRCFVALAALAVSFALASVAHAFFGEFDTAFDGDGKVTTNVSGDADDDANDVAIQPDGKIVAVGSTNTVPGGSTYDFAVVRYNTDGSLDTSFDGDSGTGNGVVTTDFSGSSDHGLAVAIQGDGKIVVAGDSVGGATGFDFGAARYNTDGTLDDATDITPATTFDTDGKVTTAVAPGAGDEDGAAGLAIQGDGKIVASGYADMGAATDYDFSVVRYNADGSLDPAFIGEGATPGIVTTDFSGDDDLTNEVAIQADGKIVVGGSSTVGSDTDFAVARYHGASGKLDNNAGDVDPAIHLDVDGKLTTTFGPGSDAIRGLAIQADGKIGVAGRATIGPTGVDAALARYNPDDGSLDTGFDGDGGSGNGKVTTALTPGANSDQAQDLAIQPDGQLVIAGQADVGGSDFNFALARYNGSNGTLDTSFAGDGVATPPIGVGLDDGARAVALQPDGKILAAGFFIKNPPADDSGDFAVARFGSTVSVPETTITSGPTDLTDDATPTFAFTSSELGSSFECRLDSGAFGSCNGGVTHTAAAPLSVGDHSFEVRATDPFGHTDTTPARDAFTVVSNAFTIGGLKGKTLTLNVSSPGTAEVTDAGAKAAANSAIAAAKKMLKTSTATGGPGAIAVKLKLTKTAKRKLRERGKVKVRARITFTPSGGTANSQVHKLKIKK